MACRATNAGIVAFWGTASARPRTKSVIAAVCPTPRRGISVAKFELMTAGNRSVLHACADKLCHMAAGGAQWRAISRVRS